jgi:hypothetical protein
VLATRAAGDEAGEAGFRFLSAELL